MTVIPCWSEAELLPPSTAGGASAYAASEAVGEPAPPTPPRQKGGALAERKGVSCSVTLPGSNVQWNQPVRSTASMQASPVGSLHPSLAPSESVYGGRSAASMSVKSGR